MSAQIAQNPPGDERVRGHRQDLRKQKGLVQRTDKGENAYLHRRYTLLCRRRQFVQSFPT